MNSAGRVEALHIEESEQERPSPSTQEEASPGQEEEEEEYDDNFTYVDVVQQR